MKVKNTQASLWSLLVSFDVRLHLMHTSRFPTNETIILFQYWVCQIAIAIPILILKISRQAADRSFQKNEFINSLILCFLVLHVCVSVFRPQTFYLYWLLCKCTKCTTTYVGPVSPFLKIHWKLSRNLFQKFSLENRSYWWKHTHTHTQNLQVWCKLVLGIDYEHMYSASKPR